MSSESKTYRTFYPYCAHSCPFSYKHGKLASTEGKLHRKFNIFCQNPLIKHDVTFEIFDIEDNDRPGSVTCKSRGVCTGNIKDTGPDGFITARGVFIPFSRSRNVGGAVGIPATFTHNGRFTNEEINSLNKTLYDQGTIGDYKKYPENDGVGHEAPPPSSFIDESYKRFVELRKASKLDRYESIEFDYKTGEIFLVNHKNGKTTIL